MHSPEFFPAAKESFLFTSKSSAKFYSESLRCWAFFLPNEPTSTLNGYPELLLSRGNGAWIVTLSLYLALSLEGINATCAMIAMKMMIEKT